VAICPTDSFIHRDIPVEKCPEADPSLIPTPEHCEHFFRSRRSIRTYLKHPPKREDISRLIDMAHYAPTGHNCQCVEWLVISDRREMVRLGKLVLDWMRRTVAETPEAASASSLAHTLQQGEHGKDVIFRNAPMLILAHAPRRIKPAPPACTIALAHLELAAPTLGLGCCWAGYFMAAAGQYPPLKESLPLPKEHVCYGAMMIGHPRFSYKRLPPRDPARIVWD
jgi:nitroreductase